MQRRRERRVGLKSGWNQALPVATVALATIWATNLVGTAQEAQTSPKPPRTEVSDTQATTAPPTSPQEALSKMQVPEGFQVSLFAAEPLVRQPIAITTDERGRLWVAENDTYAESQVNFDLRFRDRIVILEDTDGDGVADRRKVFWDQGQKLTAVAVGNGGVWALCAPQLLFIPDRDRDDVPDSEPIVMLDGWDADTVRHNIVNGLTLGPDGWLYGRHGILATSFVGKPGAPPSQRTQLNCAIWRYHPLRQTFEVVAHGTTNPWGLDFNEHGQMFFINTVIGHLWHVMPGAHYRRMYGADINPRVYQLIEQCADHFHWDTAEQWHEIRKGMSDQTSALGGGHAHCGLLIYQGDNWPQAYRDSVLTVNLHGLRLNRDRLERHGSGYVARHAADFLRAQDSWFRGIDLITGADGSVFVADWADIGECHENDGVHRSTGRIYRISYGAPQKLETFDLASKSDRELVALQLHRNDWYVRQARRLLQERAAERAIQVDAVSALEEMFRGHSDVTRRLRAMWSLWAIGRLGQADLLQALSDPNEHIRAWAIRLLADGAEPISESGRLALTDLARRESASLVRLHLASALQRLPIDDRWELARELVTRAEDDGDAMIPLMVWYGIEPSVAGAPDRAVELVRRSRLSLLHRFIARRLAEELEHTPRAIEGLVAYLAQPAPAEVQRDILTGLQDTLKGWRQAPAPGGWDQLAPRLAASDDKLVQELGRELSVVFGDGRAIDQLRQLTLDANETSQARAAALRVLVENRADDLFPLLQKLISDRVLLNEVIRALAAIDNPQVAPLVLGQYPRLDGDGRELAITTLCARPHTARALLAAVRQGTVHRRELTAFHARQIRSLGDASLNKELAELWGEIRESREDRLELIRQLKTKLTPDQLTSADRSAGRALFQQHCANCHKLFGSGTAVGPDLTGGNRQNIDYLLENIVDPSASVAADFKMSALVLHDGRTITGVVVERNSRTLAVQTQKERLTIAAGDVAEIIPQNVSLMPDGLLTPLGEDQIRALIAYLSSGSQVPLAGQ